MKNILFKKSIDKDKRKKSLSICQKTEDKESVTQVRKSFLYQVTDNNSIDPKAKPPEIHIKKSFDSRNKIEKFNFLVKGSFYMTHERVMVEVKFRHSLDIQIIWKKKVFSPQKVSGSD